MRPGTINRRQYGGLRIVRPTFPLVGRVIPNAPLPVELSAHIQFYKRLNGYLLHMAKLITDNL